MSRLRKWTRITLAGLAGLLLLAQLIPVDRDHPPVTGDLVAPPEVKAVLRRACYDCHSNETRWPWYSYVAPISWLVARDVHEGREHVNFSHWTSYSEKRRAKVRDEVREEVAAGEMPLWFYVPLHPDAKLSPAEVALLTGWGAERGTEGHTDAK